MDKQQLVDLLNEDLSLELRSVVQYVRHVATITGPQYQSTVDELKLHMTEELNHATVLAEQIDFLGGTPTTQVAPVPDVADSRAALESDLQLEEEQLDRYRERVLQCNDAGLPDVAEALKPLLEQTQEHVRDLRAALDQ